MKTKCSTSPPGDEWDDYLQGMFKKLKVDPDQLNREKRNTSATESASNSQWYMQSVRTPKKTRKSFTARTARNRPGPYKTSPPFNSGKFTFESTSKNVGRMRKNPSEDLGCTSEFDDNAPSEFGKVKGRLSSKLDGFSKQCSICRFEHRLSKRLCKCSKQSSSCQFGSSSKTKLLTFSTLATIVEESGEVTPKDDLECSGGCNLSSGAGRSVCSKRAGTEDSQSASSIKCNDTALLFKDYRDVVGIAKSPPKIPSPASTTQLHPLAPAPIQSHYAVSNARTTQMQAGTENRPILRPEYTCSQEARMAQNGLLDDTSVDDLAGYFDSIVYIPRKMSAMAEMMYT